MAQHAHVPKFGDWDGENVPYTTYFENARKEKGVGLKMNPNDPEENPDAFIYADKKPESDGFHHVWVPPSRPTSDKMDPAGKHRIEERPNREQGSGRHDAHQGIALDQQKSRNRKNLNSESVSDKSSSDNSLLYPNQRQVRPGRKKSQGESSNSLSPSYPGPVGLRTENHRVGDMIHRPAASVPKFGAWDETDPTSGEGFTIIFNKVKEEKKIGAVKLPTIPSQPDSYSSGQKKNGSSSCGSMICCCLFSRGDS